MFLLLNSRTHDSSFARENPIAARKTLRACAAQARGTRVRDIAPIPAIPGVSRMKFKFSVPRSARRRAGGDTGEKSGVGQCARLTPACGDFYAAGLSMPPPVGRYVDRANPEEGKS